MLRIGVVMYQTSLTKGQELVAQRMVREFRRQGHEAFLITSIYHDSTPVVEAAEVKANGGYVESFDEVLGVPVVRVNSELGTWPPRRVSFVNFMSVLPRLVDELRLDVLITHSTLWNGPEDAATFARWRKMLIEGGSLDHPIVLCHMSHLQEPDEEMYTIRERAYRSAWNSTVMPSLLTASGIVLVTTPQEAESMKKLGARREKIFLFPGGIDEAGSLSAGAGALSLQAKLPQGVKIVASLGTVEKRKNALAVVRAAAILSNRSDIHFVIAGKLEGQYGRQVREEAARLRNVSVLGEVSEPEKVALIRHSFVNICMSRSEALGISQLEFMNAGVPVITSGVGGQSWIVRDSFNGLIIDGPDDAEGAAKSIVRLADDLELTNRLGSNAEQFASQFLISRLINRLVSELWTKTPAVSPGPKLQVDESVIDAWALKSQRVAATSIRLIVRSAKGGRSAVTIPYKEIAKIARVSRAPWAVLGLGASLTLALLLARLLHLGVTPGYAMPVLSVVTVAFGLGNATGTLADLLPFLPLVLSSIAFLGRIHQGYQIEYGESKEKLFLPKRFLRALRLVDDLTPNSLFDDDR
ncbi:MAG: glycosyltransferase family 4 protein [Nitrososphaerales archaeon]